MAKVSSSIKSEPYKVEIKSSSGNIIIADEPIEKGGKNLGFSPSELLAAALAACTSATVKMYVDHKGWDLQELKLEIELERDEEVNKTFITRKMELTGNLNEEQKTRILNVANKCPVHKILTNPIEIETVVA
jgi:putative redox protein